MAINKAAAAMKKSREDGETSEVINPPSEKSGHTLLTDCIQNVEKTFYPSSVPTINAESEAVAAHIVAASGPAMKTITFIAVA
jgi:hypothetical protein